MDCPLTGMFAGQTEVPVLWANFSCILVAMNGKLEFPCAWTNPMRRDLQHSFRSVQCNQAPSRRCSLPLLPANASKVFGKMNCVLLCASAGNDKLGKHVWSFYIAPKCLFSASNSALCLSIKYISWGSPSSVIDSTSTGSDAADSIGDGRPGAGSCEVPDFCLNTWLFPFDPVIGTQAQTCLKALPFLIGSIISICSCTPSLFKIYFTRCMDAYKCIS